MKKELVFTKLRKENIVVIYATFLNSTRRRNTLVNPNNILTMLKVNNFKNKHNFSIINRLV